MRQTPRPVGRRAVRHAAPAVVLAAALVAGCSSAGSGPEEPDPTYTAESEVLQPGLPGEPASTVAPGTTATRPPAPTFNDADVEYVQDMLRHHAQAITMSGLAPERASNPQVASIASRISDSQQPEIAVFGEWLTQRRQLRQDPDGHTHAMPGMATPQQLEQLEAARGTAFDRLFLTLMAAHHRGAVEMSSGVMTKGTDPQVQELAAEIGAGQAAEINRMTDVARTLPSG